MAVERLKLVENDSVSKFSPSDLIDTINFSHNLYDYVRSMFEYVIESEQLPYFVQVAGANQNWDDDVYNKTRRYIGVKLYDINDFDLNSDTPLSYQVRYNKIKPISTSWACLTICKPFRLALDFYRDNVYLYLTNGNNLVSVSSMSNVIKSFIEQHT